MSLRCIASATLALIFAVLPSTIAAADPIVGEARPGYEVVDLFPAMEAGEIIATVHARDSKALNLAIENKTDRKLAVRMPDAFAAVPVHAQFQPGNFQNFNQNNNNAGNQGIGGPGGQFNNNFNQNGNNNNLFNNPGIFNVPPGKVIRAKRPAVCLEHGKDDPNPRIEYELRPIESVIDDPEITSMLQLLALGAKQRVVQLAVWHRANGKTWEELAALKVNRLRGPDTPQFTSNEIEAAKTLAEALRTPTGATAYRD